MSNYAHSLHLAFELDVAGGNDIATAMAAEDYARAYSLAEAGRNGVDEFRGAFAAKAPTGFTRTETAVDLYLGEIRDRFDAIMTMTDDPRPSTIAKYREIASQTYAKVVIDDFTSDLAHTNLSDPQQQRVIDRLLGNRP